MIPQCRGIGCLQGLLREGGTGSSAIVLSLLPPHLSPDSGVALDGDSVESGLLHSLSVFVVSGISTVSVIVSRSNGLID
eukprot:1740284-Rhodomonas_salina.2